MPGHTNNKTTYTVYGTNKPYTGKVVEIGGFIYSTESGALECVPFGQQLVATQNQNQSDVVTDSMAPLMTEQNVTTPTPSQNEDVVTPFVVGDGSSFGIGNYFYFDGNQVPNGTELHHHTIIPEGRTSNFMTQHIMDGNDVDVFTSPPNQQAQITGGPTNEQTTPQTGMGGTTGGGFSY